MKKIIVVVAVIASFLGSCKGTPKKSVEVKEVEKTVISASELNNVDVATSVITWKGNKPMGSHNGVISLKNGSLLVEDGKILEGNFVIDMNTITNVDMKGSGGAAKIERHLKSADFFDITVYPTSSFEVTNVENMEGNLAVTGNLQIKDVTKSVTIAAVLSETDSTLVLKSTVFNINRADFNIKYKSKSFFDNLADKFVDDLVEMSFEVVVKE